MNFSLVTATLILALGFATSALGAPRCSALRSGPKGCRNEIRACVGTSACTQAPTGRERRRCKGLCKRDVLRACRQGALLCSASPSGAFLD
jgi:hypothetical protein